MSVWESVPFYLDSDLVRASGTAFEVADVFRRAVAVICDARRNEVVIPIVYYLIELDLRQWLKEHPSGSLGCPRHTIGGSPNEPVCDECEARFLEVQQDALETLRLIALHGQRSAALKVGGRRS